MLLAWGHSHRTAADGELIRWGTDLARVEGDVEVASDVIEVAIVRAGAGATAGRKRIRVNGLGRRAAGLAGLLRVVVFAPEEMLLIAGSPSLRRAALDQLAVRGRRSTPMRSRRTAGRSSSATASCARSARKARLATSSASGIPPSSTPAGPSSRSAGGCSGSSPSRSRPRTPRSRPTRPRPPGSASAYVTNAPPLPGESPRDALARRLAETAEKEVWNGSTLVGPHRDDIAFELGGRDLAGFASRGQQRTAILAFKLAELDVLTALDGRPPLLLLDDVFSELDPDRRSHLVRRIAELPQAFVTTTTLDDLDPGLRAIATAWEVRVGADGRRRSSRARATRPRGTRPVAGEPAESRPVSVRKRPPADDPHRRPHPGRRPPARTRGRASPVPRDRDVRGARRGARPGRLRAPAGWSGSRASPSMSRPTRRSSPRSCGSASTELLAAFATAPGGVGVRELRVHVRRAGPRV